MKPPRAAVARSLITSASAFGFEVKGFSRKKDKHFKEHSGKICRSQGRWTNFLNCPVSVAHQFLCRSDGFSAGAGPSHVVSHVSVRSSSWLPFSTPHGAGVLLWSMTKSCCWPRPCRSHFSHDSDRRLESFVGHSMAHESRRHVGAVAVATWSNFVLRHPRLCVATCLMITQWIWGSLVLWWDLPSVFMNVWNFLLMLGRLILSFVSHSHSDGGFKRCWKGKLGVAHVWRKWQPAVELAQCVRRIGRAMTMTMTMTHSEKSHICQMKAWPYRQECRDHGPTKKNLFYCCILLVGKVCRYKLLEDRLYRNGT